MTFTRRQQNNPTRIRTTTKLRLPSSLLSEEKSKVNIVFLLIKQETEKNVVYIYLESQLTETFERRAKVHTYFGQVA